MTRRSVKICMSIYIHTKTKYQLSHLKFDHYVFVPRAPNLPHLTGIDTSVAQPVPITHRTFYSLLYLVSTQNNNYTYYMHRHKIKKTYLKRWKGHLNAL